jgi:ketosteroid isomerase-like protein
VKKTLYATPQEAEAAFYEAFARRDLDAMMAVWADDDEVYCIHPGGPRTTGVAQVRESWRQIFASGQSLQFQLMQQHRLQAMMIAIHCVYEQISVTGEPRTRGSIVATNIYMRTGHGWRMMAHHASPAPHVAHVESRENTLLH